MRNSVVTTLSCILALMAVTGCGDDPEMLAGDSGLDASSDGAAEDGGPAEDSAVTGDASSDAGAAEDAGQDAGVGDAGTDAGVDAGFLPAPSIASPTQNSDVFGIVSVSGSSRPNAVIRAQLMRGATPLSDASSTSNGTGSFSLSIPYAGLTDGDALTLSVVQVDGGITSSAATVALRHEAASRLEGTLTQSGGDTAGDTAYVLAYDNDSVDAIVSPVAIVPVPATDGVLLPSTSFSLHVPNGTYFLRAFRDSDLPNQLPSLGEAQAPLTGPVVVSGASSGTSLALAAPTSTGNYQTLDAFVFAESQADFPPAGNGFGRCGGTYLRMEARRSSGPLSEMRVRTPSAAVITLLDDGACSAAVRDNRSSSYDSAASDGRVSFGVANPTALDAGTYRFFYRQTADDHIELWADTVASTNALSPSRLLAPSGASITQSRTPLIEWLSVPNASVYAVRATPSAGSSFSTNTSNTSATPPFLSAFACYSVTIQAETRGSDGRSEKDAVSLSHPDGFCVDISSSGSESMELSGSITNMTGVSAPIVVRGETEPGQFATVRLAPGTSSYRLGIKESQGGTGKVFAFLDVDGSFSPDTEGNLRFQTEDTFAQTVADTVVNLVFTGPGVRGNPST